MHRLWYIKVKNDNINDRKMTLKIWTLQHDAAKFKMEEAPNFIVNLFGGYANNYDLCIDTSKIGVDKTIDILENYIRNRI